MSCDELSPLPQAAPRPTRRANGSRRSPGQPAGARDAIPVRRERAVGAVEDSAKHGRDRQEVERIGPPDTAHHIPIYVSALNLSPVVQKKPQIGDQIFPGGQALRDPIALEGRDLKPPGVQGVFPERDPPSIMSPDQTTRRERGPIHRRYGAGATTTSVKLPGTMLGLGRG